VAEISQTLDRGLGLLEALAESSDGLTIAEAAVALNVNRTIIHRLLTTLERHRLVRRGTGGRFFIGFGLLGLAASIQPVLRRVVQPVLRSLADDVAATAHLTVVDGAEALAVAVVEPTRTEYHVAYRVGSRHPLNQGAAGRAILAGRAGQNMPVATSGELQAGANGIAAPVFAGPGIEASVGVIDLEPLDAVVIGPRVIRAADELAGRLS
jgi:DNA-binding IclR family transcriptional regulator